MPLPKPPQTVHDPHATAPVDSSRTRATSMSAIPRPHAATQLSETAPASSPMSHAPQALLPGTVLQGRYSIEGVLGTGGMSVVYRGRDTRFTQVARYCAIKEMFQTAPDTLTRMLRLHHFEREAGLLATINHPAVPKVYDFFEEHGRVYAIMELVPGTDLEALLHQHGKPFAQARVANWALQLCDVLHHLHTAGSEPIIFRDLKPSNIMVTPDERIVVIDFGIARVFADEQQGKGTLIGTEGYAPPEQYRGVVDVRGDVYALGATLHHLLTNVDPRTEVPFTFHERSVRLFNPSVSAVFEDVLNNTLQYDMDSRPQSIAEVKALLLSVPTIGTTGGSHAATLVPAATAHKASTELVWRFPTGDEVRSSPHVHKDVVFVGSYDKHVYALDAHAGTQRWRRATLGGVSSSPTVANDLVIVASEDGSVYALDPRTGAPRWSMRTERAVRSSPRALDRVVYVGSDDQHVYALDALNGREMWKQRTWMPVRSSCAVKNGLVAVGSMDGHVYAWDAASGSLRWKQRTTQGIISSPVIENDLVIVGSMDRSVYALNTENGKPVWRVRTEHFVNASPVVHDKWVFVGGVDGNLYALELKTGRKLWKYAFGCQITSSARVANGTVYVGGTDGSVRAIDAQNGTLVWHYQTDGAVVSSPAIHGGTVYIGSLDKHVYALEA